MTDAARRILFLSLLGSAGCSAADNLFCSGDTCGFTDLEWSRLSSLADLPEVPPFDTSNRFEHDLEVQLLGREFYFDTRFSGVATQVDALGRESVPARAPKGTPINVSCASCHDLSRMGIDRSSQPGNVSEGAGWTDVNALAVVNSSYQHQFFTNGRADSQWALAAAVAESPTTMNGNRLHTAWVINDVYRARYEEAFPADPLPEALTVLSLCQAKTLDHPLVPLNGKPGKAGCDPTDATEPFGDAWDCLDETAFPTLKDDLTRVLVNWAKAIAAYESQLTSVRSPFDRFMDEGSSSTALDARQQWGARLFVGKAGCYDCHNTPYFSDGAFHNIGVPQTGFLVPTLYDCQPGTNCDCTGKGDRCLPWGAYDGLTKLKKSPWLRTSKWSDDTRLGSPADAVTLEPSNIDPALKGAWRTPTLRNVALTAPYMHDGLYATLEDVVWHYDRGGDASAVGTRAASMRPLGLTAEEQDALVAFLRSLTGEPLPLEKRRAPTLAPSSVCP